MRLAVVILSCFVTACAASPSGHGCQSAVNAKLAEFGVTPDQIARTVVSREIGGGDNDRVVGYTYWMQPASCRSGNLIVDTNAFCYVQQVYTTRECQVPGVPHY